MSEFSDDDAHQEMQLLSSKLALAALAGILVLGPGLWGLPAYIWQQIYLAQLNHRFDQLAHPPDSQFVYRSSQIVYDRICYFEIKEYRTLPDPSWLALTDQHYARQLSRTAKVSKSEEIVLMSSLSNSQEMLDEVPQSAASFQQLRQPTDDLLQIYYQELISDWDRDPWACN
ncbi:MAG: hypothetical protein CVV27_02530 [Candidatus Melainabacteria bacterium HGW-Melainabacteria-1]|nr:MAG: hypothetical protein CVV27_02530 [Candidatus Melainabacteria bacterium HGW-Melainabacteria-1]